MTGVQTCALPIYFVPDSIKDEMRKRTDWGDLLEPKALTPPSPEERKAIIRKPDW